MLKLDILKLIARIQGVLFGVSRYLEFKLKNSESLSYFFHHRFPCCYRHLMHTVFCGPPQERITFCNCQDPAGPALPTNRLENFI